MQLVTQARTTTAQTFINGLMAIGQGHSYNYISYTNNRSIVHYCNGVTMSFIEVSANSDFPIQNLPYGVFSTKEDVSSTNYFIFTASIHRNGAFDQVIKKRVCLWVETKSHSLTGVFNDNIKADHRYQNKRFATT